MIVYDNRNGFVYAYDTKAKRFLACGAPVDPESPFDGVAGPAYPAEPEPVHAELVRRGVATVYVYTGPVPSWVDGSIIARTDRLRKFRHMASQARAGSHSWAAVPVGRLVDGSDWSDVYGPRR